MPVSTDFHPHCVPLRRKIRTVQQIVRTCKCILRDDITCETRVKVYHIYIGARSSERLQARNHLVYDRSHHRLKLLNLEKNDARLPRRMRCSSWLTVENAAVPVANMFTVQSHFMVLLEDPGYTSSMYSGSFM